MRFYFTISFDSKEQLFYLKGLLKCRAAFQSCIDVTIKDGKETSLWLDHWYGDTSLRNR